MLFGHCKISASSSPPSGSATSPGHLHYGAFDVRADQVLATPFGWVAMSGQAKSIQNGKPIALESIAEQYLALQEDFLTAIDGAFAIAIHDANKNKLLLAIDRMGIERLTFRHDGEDVCFGTNAIDVAGDDRKIDPQQLFNYLFFHMVPAPHTTFAGVSKLSPGCRADFFNTNVVKVTRYWSPRFNYGLGQTEAAQQLHENLARAIRDCQPDSKSGAFLSGGLDSSSVSGVLAAQVTHQPKTFSIGFDEAGYDELPWARIAANHFGCEGFEYKVKPDDIVDAFCDIAACYDEPFGNSSVVPTYLCAKLAREHGVTHLLAGDGGDELFAGNERYASQKIFEAYSRLPGWSRHKFFDPLAQSIQPNNEVTLLRKYKSYIEQANIPLPERLETWNYAYRERVGTFLTSEFSVAIDTNAPIHMMAEYYASCGADNSTDRLQQYDWKFTLADSDFRKVTAMCAMAGVSVSFPMVHHSLVELACRISPALKIPRLKLRRFYKQAMHDFLPNEILNKPKHGFGLPFGQWLKKHKPLQELIFSNLTDLKSTGIFQPAFIDKLIDEHRAGHAAYYGYFIWDLAMLQQWLVNHRITV